MKSQAQQKRELQEHLVLLQQYRAAIGEFASENRYFVGGKWRTKDELTGC